MKTPTAFRRFAPALPVLLIAYLSLPACGGGGGSGGGNSNPPPPPPPPGITVVIAPLSALMRPGTTQQFDATVSNATNASVTWSVNDEIGGNATAGTISSDGLYTSPGTAPNPGTVTIAATSDEDATKSGSAAVTVVDIGVGVNDALLDGSYAFVFSGSEDSAGVFVAGGTFVADGHGTIQDGREDGNFAGGSFETQPFTGLYSIGADRRGTMVFANTAGSDCGCAPTQFTLKFNVVSSNLAHFVEFDGLGAGVGTIEKQDATAFALGSTDGPFVFLLDGLDFDSRLSLAGRFSFTSGALSEGVADINDAETISLERSLDGFLTLGAHGRGTVSLNTPVGDLHFAYYLVSDEKLLLVGTDIFPVLTGLAMRQTASPFSGASLVGKYVFGMTASTHPRPQKVIRADAGSFEADGLDQIANGVLDRNSPSGVLSGSLLSGTYTLGTNGRGTATLDTEAGTENLVFYMATPSDGFALQVDASDADVNNVASGRLRRQESNVFSVASWNGTYGALVTGSGSSDDPTNITGTLEADGAGALGAAQDRYDGSLQADESFTGSYTVQVTGQGTANWGGTDFNAHFVSGSEILLIGTNPGEVRFGTALKQE